MCNKLIGITILSSNEQATAIIAGKPHRVYSEPVNTMVLKQATRGRARTTTVPLQRQPIFLPNSF